MAVSTKTIKRRIKSISNTKKITKAMEMISAVKMRRAVANVLATRSYANLAWDVLKEIAARTDVRRHPLLSQRPVKCIGLILITSNRGLAGGFSSRLLQAVDEYIKKSSRPVILSGAKNLVGQSDSDRTRSLAPTQDDNIKVEIIVTGKRGKKIYHKFGHTVVAEFDKIDLTTKIEEILPMAQMAVKDYIEGKYDKIVVAYTDFKSAIEQIPIIKQLLPFEETSQAKPEMQEEDETEKVLDDTLTFEPSPEEVLEILLPRLVEMQMYQAILESDASEHSARMLAMRNASDAAGDMIKELQYSFNKARQAAITQEISEIVGGAAALE